MVEGLIEQKPLGVDFHHRLEEEQRAVGLKVWSLARPLPLSERVPVLENMGFRVVDERTFRIAPNGEQAHDVWFHDMLLERRDGGAIDLDSRESTAGGRFPDGDARAGRERRLQRADSGRRRSPGAMWR